MCYSPILKVLTALYVQRGSGAVWRQHDWDSTRRHHQLRGVDVRHHAWLHSVRLDDHLITLLFSRRRRLSFRRNQLMGSIPSSIGALTLLRCAVESTLAFFRTLPRHGFGARSRARFRTRELELQDNAFNGTIPATMWRLTALQ
jgi:hypothetical protein